ncbi:hypothetical protein Pyn_34657 [Prunus yedoensis var. nudiflora]|uniref:Uncharacterized protein n=1 Tax=Prunus yedoensis var. nudiflora TaxID=2094558 RepID=A0A314YY91_PRUYE|nr:hypothetical protein Pyn_34657 [Prunus yedoensis var. nudiflora]
MDQIVKILENTIPIPSIPDRPLSLLSHTDDAEDLQGASMSSAHGHGRKLASSSVAAGAVAPLNSLYCILTLLFG